MKIKSFVTAGMIIGICAGCAGLVPGTPTSFFTFHDPNAHFEGLAETRGYELLGGSFGYSIGDLPGEKKFERSIKGDESLRNAIMQEYQAYIESLLLVSGATIGGEITEGEVSKFEFDY